VIAYFNEPMPELAETVFGRGRVTRALMWIEQLAIRFADHTFTVTEELKARFVERGASPDRISVILNGADPNIRLAGWQPRQPDTDKTGFVIVCHGAIEDRYGQDTIIEAARLLRPELPDLRVVFTGRGSFVPDMLQLIDRAGLGDVISFKGWVPRVELNDVLHSADVGIVAQKASPYSHLVHTNKMVDYWILGLPVIASRLDAVSALYGDDVLEFYEPDDAADLARAIRRLHGDEARRIELVRNGRAAQERNGWAAQEKIFLGVYEKLVRADG
jgi:glycosyltransferase involved in cell wall biosynthesis